MSENNCNEIKLSIIEKTIGAIGLVAICLVTFGVFTRFVLKISIAWSDELLRTLFIWSYFIGSAMQYKSEGLMSLDLFPISLLNKGKLKSYKIVKLAQEAVVLIFSAIFSYNVFKIIKSQVINNQVTTTSGAPAWISPLGVFIGMVLISLISVKKIIETPKMIEHE